MAGQTVWRSVGSAVSDLVLDRESNDMAFGKDVYRLMQYVLEQAPLLEKYDVYIYLSSAEYHNQWFYMVFGKSRPWERLSARQFKHDEAKVAYLVRWGVDSIRIQAHQNSAAAREEIEKAAVFGIRAVTSSDCREAVPAPASAPELTEREMVEGEHQRNSSAED